MKQYKMVLTRKEMETMELVMQICAETPWEVLNKFMGSRTVKDAQALGRKLSYREYCESHNIRYEDMDEEDFVDAYLERVDNFNSYEFD